MYKKLLPALLLMSSATAFAQPTLTFVTSNPEINDQFVSVACDTTGITPGGGGMDITWTYTALPNLLVPATFITPNLDTATVTAFSTSNPGYTDLLTAAGGLGSTTAFLGSTNAIASPSGMGTTYVQALGDKVSQTGVYISTTDFAVYTDPMDQLRYPFTYNSTFTDTYAGALVYTPPVGSPVLATESGSVTVTADAWGTLVLPGNTYANVLRVHSSQSFRDSADVFGVGENDTWDLETYTWYVPGYHSPLLTISTASDALLGVNTKTVSYASRQLANHDAVPTVKGIDNSLSLYPNPASGYIYLSYNNADDQTVCTSLIDMLGREVAVIANQKSQGVTNLTYNTSSLAKGSYFVRLQSADETVTRKLVIQ